MINRFITITIKHEGILLDSTVFLKILNTILKICLRLLFLALFIRLLTGTRAMNLNIFEDEN